jgi:hypothetical protein
VELPTAVGGLKTRKGCRCGIAFSFIFLSRFFDSCLFLKQSTMKKISLSVLLISILLLSCTKQIDTSSISTSVSSNAATHANYEIPYLVDGVGYYNCRGINEGIYFTGENILRVSYMLRGTVTNVILKGRSKGITGIGLETGNHYVVISHSIDKTFADWSEDAKVKTRVGLCFGV